MQRVYKKEEAFQAAMEDLEENFHAELMGSFKKASEAFNRVHTLKETANSKQLKFNLTSHMYKVLFTIF